MPTWGMRCSAAPSLTAAGSASRCWRRDRGGGGNVDRMPRQGYLRWSRRALCASRAGFPSESSFSAAAIVTGDRLQIPTTPVPSSIRLVRLATAVAGPNQRISAADLPRNDLVRARHLDEAAEAEPHVEARKPVGLAARHRDVLRTKVRAILFVNHESGCLL